MPKKVEVYKVRPQFDKFLRQLWKNPAQNEWQSAFRQILWNFGIS